MRQLLSLIFILLVLYYFIILKTKNVNEKNRLQDGGIVYLFMRPVLEEVSKKGILTVQHLRLLQNLHTLYKCFDRNYVLMFIFFVIGNISSYGLSSS